MPVTKRRLPQHRNPLLATEQSLDELIRRRRLGRTDLLNPTNFGSPKSPEATFDYAHLRAPLPTDLRRSGIFSPLKTGLYPESYFLMRRSSDGYVSVTGMYKAAFPWSTGDEEHNERRYHRSQPSFKGEEIAGNVWLAPEDALKLAEEYSMLPWIVALLDPAPIEISSNLKDRVHSNVATPPKFVIPDKDKLTSLPDLPVPTPRGRSKRSASPAKQKAAGAEATPARKIATPRKRGARAASAKAEDKAPEVPSMKTSKSVVDAKTKDQSKLENGSPVVQKLSKSDKKTATKADDTVVVAVKETVETGRDLETVRTQVSVQVPASHPDLPIPNSTEKIISQAKAIAEKASKVDKTNSESKGTKRKASSLGKDREEDAKSGASPGGSVAKKVKTGLEEKLATERVRTRALVGIAATLAVGAVLPYFL